MTDHPQDPWHAFRKFTAARIALGRSGNGLPTSHLLDFQLAHAKARDAVLGTMNAETLAADLTGDTIVVSSEARDRATYLQRPDLGRQLTPEDREKLDGRSPSPSPDLVFVIGDGLSAFAVHTYAAATLTKAVTLLPDLSVGPIVLAHQARVALGDDIAVALGARAVVILIGERPGLSAADSLGAYLTYAPKIGSQNSDRNCVSNIRDGGLTPDEGAARIAYLVRAAFKQGESGYQLKDLSEPQPLLTTQTEHE